MVELKVVVVDDVSGVDGALSENAIEGEWELL